MPRKGLYLLENNVEEESHYDYLQSLPENERFKLFRDIAGSDLFTAKQKLVLAKKYDVEGKVQLTDEYKESGGLPIKRVDAEISTEGMLHMLTTKSTVAETLNHVEQTFNQPEGWARQAKNKPLSNAERKKNIQRLKDKHKQNNIPLLQQLLDENFTTFKEIQEPETYGKQLGHLHSVIKLSERVDALEYEVEELRKFKEHQLLFNQVVVNEISAQREIVHNILEMGLPRYNSTPEEISELRMQISLIESEPDKITFLLSNGLNKKQVSTFLEIPLRTFMRKCKKYGI